MLLWQESVLTSLGFRFRESKRNRQRSFREPTEPEAQFPRMSSLGNSVNREAVRPLVASLDARSLPTKRGHIALVHLPSLLA